MTWPRPRRSCPRGRTGTRGGERGDLARRTAADVRVANFEMLEVARFNGLARNVEFTVEVEPEACVGVARESHMRPRFGCDRLRGDDDIVDCATDPHAKAAVVKVGVE